MINAEILFFIGTVALWTGGLMVASAVFKGVRALLAPEGERSILLNGLIMPLAIGAVVFVIGLLIPGDPGRPPGTGIRIPLVWLMLSFPGWLALVCWFVAVGRLVQSTIGVSQTERMDRLKAAGFLALSGVFLWWWHSQLNEPTAILKGAIYVQPLVLIAFVLLALVAVAAMSYAEKAIRSKGMAAKAATTLTLLVGCLVFGFPFFWLLLTSFKEDRDLANTDGILWVPRVQQTHPFKDTKKPLAETKYLGRTVQVTILEALPNGRTLLEIERPYGLMGRRFDAAPGEFTPIPRQALMYEAPYKGQQVVGFVAEELENGNRLLEVLEPASLAGQRFESTPAESQPYYKTGLRWQNYSEALEWMPLEASYGLQYLRNTMILVVLTVIGTLLSCSFVAYGFSRLSFPGKEFLFGVMLATMMLPGAVTMLPSFLIFRQLGWIDSLRPLWVPTFFAGAFNVFLINQFFKTIPMELEDAAKIDGCSYLRTYWQVMLPLISPALAAIAIWTFMGSWNNFMGPLIYISSPENMPLAYAVQLFNSERGGSFGLMMAFGTLATVPVLVLFFAAQRWFIEGVQLSGLGGR